MTSPGVPMNYDGDSWYSYTIVGAKSADIKISVPEYDYETTLQEKQGEDWYLAGDTWSKEEPVVGDQYKDTDKEVEVDAENVAATSTVTVHCFCDSDTPKIYYWNAMPKDQKTQWPGATMTEEENGWYSYTFKETSKINVLFVMSGRQTEDYNAKTGEWWFDGNTWSDKKPEIGSQPSTTSKPSQGSDKEDADATPAPTVDPSVLNKGTTDFREESIYFLMTARFADGDSTNNVHCEHDAVVKNGDDDPAWRGDFKGLIEKLDYIKALGFSAIWITPVVENASSYDYHGYHALNFKKVAPRLETPGATYQDLIKACHSKEIKVVQDIVFNHTSQWGEEGLCELFDQEYVLDKGAAGNSVTKVRKDNGKLDQVIGDACKQVAMRLVLAMTM